VGAAREAVNTDPLVWQTAASGFRDTSRLASSDLTMMVDILLTNRKAVVDALDSYGEQLSALGRLVADGDEPELRAALGALRDEREGAYRETHGSYGDTGEGG
jgi:prephenate dehydrogenase